MPDDGGSTSLFEALNAASAAVARAETVDEVYPAAVSALRALGFHVNIYEVVDEQTARLEHYTYSETLVSKVMALTGLDRKYRAHIDSVPLFREVIREGHTRFVGDTTEVLKHVVPGGSSTVARTVTKLMDIARCIGAPVRVDDEVRGMFIVLANHLVAEQVPAMEAFANLLGRTVSRIALLNQLRQSLAELEQAQAQLVQARKMEAVGRLTAGIAHDFNNLLTPAVWAVESLEKEALAPDNEALATLRHVLSSATKLTQQLLAFGRKQVLNRTRIDLNEVTTQATALLQRVLGEDVRIETALHDTPLFVNADALQLEQVLVNLALNARDAMVPGGRLVFRTSRGATSAAGDVEVTEEALLSIEDDGAGMSTKVLERAVEPFFTTKEAGAGSGLGLSVVQGIVAQHEGRMELESAPGRGTRIDIYLPIDHSKPVRESKLLLPALPLDVETAWVLEDRPEVRRILVRSLARHRIAVEEAADLAEARALLAEKPLPQLLISDVVLPDGTGLDFVAELRDQAPQVAVVVASGHPLQDERGARMGQLADAYLAKPFTQTGLTRAIAEAVAAAEERNGLPETTG